MAVTLVTGPVRSGKSRYVAQLAAASGRRVTYVATALRAADDPEWEERLRRHALERPGDWETLETAAFTHAELLAVFADAPPERCLVVDAMGTWLSARLSGSIEKFERDYAAFEAQMDREAEELAETMLRSRAEILVVAEEVGWDVVPVKASARLFRDVLGRFKQRLASRASRCYLVVSGFALDMRALGAAVE